MFYLQYILSYSERSDSTDVIQAVVTQLRDEDLRLGFTLKLLIHAVSYQYTAKSLLNM